MSSPRHFDPAKGRGETSNSLCKSFITRTPKKLS